MRLLSSTAGSPPAGYELIPASLADDGQGVAFLCQKRAAEGQAVTEAVVEVMAIHEGGIVAEHNQRNPDTALEIGDMILSVNGVHGDWEEMQVHWGFFSSVVWMW